MEPDLLRVLLAQRDATRAPRGEPAVPDRVGPAYGGRPLPAPEYDRMLSGTIPDFLLGGRVLKGKEFKELVEQLRKITKARRLMSPTMHRLGNPVQGTVLQHPEVSEHTRELGSRVRAHKQFGDAGLIPSQPKDLCGRQACPGVVPWLD